MHRSLWSFLAPWCKWLRENCLTFSIWEQSRIELFQAADYKITLKDFPSFSPLPLLWLLSVCKHYANTLFPKWQGHCSCEFIEAHTRDRHRKALYGFSLPETLIYGTLEENENMKTLFTMICLHSGAVLNSGA